MNSAQSKFESYNKRQALGLGILLITSAMFGGGGVSYGLMNAAVQLVTILMLGLNTQAISNFWLTAPRILRILIAASLAIPILQLVPVPPAIWQSLPGRELVTESLSVAGLTAGWRAITVDAGRTMIALFSLLVPLVVLTLGWRLTQRRLQLLGWLMVGIGTLVFLWGIPQVLSQSSLAIPYPENPMPGVLFGSFANRNTTAVFFLVCLIFSLQLDLPSRLQAFATLFRLGLTLMFITGVILTQSRSGLILIAVPIALWSARAVSSLSVSSIRAKILVFTGLLATLVVGATFVGPSGTRLQTVAERFEDGGGYRIEMWEDVQYASERYWPIGSGMGTFDEVFQIDESLEYLSPRTAGRAHNDYLELAIEGGLAAIALLIGWLIWLAWLAWRTRGNVGRWIAWSGASSLLIIALQSILDYPLRNLTMLTVAAFAMLLLVRFSEIPDGKRR